MTNNQKMKLMELEMQRDDILAKCSGWKQCQDGSYEMALHYAGYDGVCKKIEELKEHAHAN